MIEWINSFRMKYGMEVCQTHQGKEECWLWVKMKDDEVHTCWSLISIERESVLSGRTLAEI